VFLIDRYGRRPLLLYSQASMVVFNGILTLSLNLSNPNDTGGWAYVSMIAIYCNVAAFSIGPATVSFVIAPELWSHGPRPAAVSIVLQVNWWSMFVVNLLFPFFQ
ncbi:solute carrier family 2, facilitated glucose transporter member 4-like, partial [Saccoglossus kowalevskii]